jgi:hypothetical protein
VPMQFRNDPTAGKLTGEYGGASSEITHNRHWRYHDVSIEPTSNGWFSRPSWYDEGRDLTGAFISLPG